MKGKPSERAAFFMPAQRWEDAVTIAQIAYVASRYQTLMASKTHSACVYAAVRLGVLDEMAAEYERLRRSARYRAVVLGDAYV